MLCGKASVNSVTLCHPLLYGRRVAPSEEDGGTLEKGTDIYPAPTQDSAMASGQRSASPPSPLALCGHPRRCATSRALQRHPRRCGNSGRQDTVTSTVVHLTTSCQLHPRVSVRTATKREVPTQPPSKPLLGENRTYLDARREQDSPGPPSTPQHCTPYRHTYLEQCDTIVNRLPWPIKGGAVP
jgi:hypothetical protein